MRWAIKFDDGQFARTFATKDDAIRFALFFCFPRWRVAPVREA